ncbi:hypothetical protein SAMN04488546_0056 [Geodermatophilus poikilotrophus]|uniref:Uncharacterized protein n=2 Tax=Geodermatophilus poikilotrophus TaxID=1333667 RepID=A0A1H9YF94_9ACTN|nr:hypothetical protein SAMN04488546_0056 [Geodermatophilus poikilotrophus]
MLAWAKRHIPEALLIPAGLGALTVTTLSDIDEVVPWGQELGIGVSELAFAYVGAYIFNWLIVERPRAKALQGYYVAAGTELEELVYSPVQIVQHLFLICNPAIDAPTSTSADNLERLLSSVNWAEMDKQGMHPEKFLGYIVESYKSAYQSLAPILNNFEPPVSVAIAQLNAQEIHRILKYLFDHPSAASMGNMQDIFVDALVRYQRAGLRLAQALEESRYTGRLKRRGSNGAPTTSLYSAVQAS